MDQASLIQTVVEEVIRRLDGSAAPQSATQRAHSGGTGEGAFGVFNRVDDAVDAAARAQSQLADLGLDTRDAICGMLKRMARENAREWGRIELEETGVGRPDHKVEKLQMLEQVPGVEFLRSDAHSGDAGVSLDEHAPWGVIGVITPVTHSIPTLTSNAINMIAAGNALVCNPHPSAANCAAAAAEAFNRAIAERFGIENLICVISPPTLESADALFKHSHVPLLTVTGGPGVARAALNQPKRAIVAGPGNPPVVVDETADLDRAARSIIEGAAFDNNLLCIGEKEVFVVDRVFKPMMDAMARAGAERLDEAALQRLTDAAFDWQEDHYAVSKQLVGQGAARVAEAAGASVRSGCELLYAEADESNPFVPEEQMMPFVPFVRAPSTDAAIDLAIRHEHGFGHTALVHSQRLETITRMGQAINTTIFVANGSSLAGMGVGGEGYPSYSVATPTGEGITNPLTFTRFRRMTVSGALRVV